MWLRTLGCVPARAWACQIAAATMGAKASSSAASVEARRGRVVALPTDIEPCTSPSQQS